jgi:hypothetical protein
MPLDTDIELVNLPKEGRFKVVQLFVKEKPVMVCGPYGSYHAKILGDYLKQEGVPFQTDKPDFSAVILPRLTGLDYRVVGMGESNVDSKTNKPKIPHGGSVSYDIYTDSDFEERLVLQLAKI